MEACENVKLFTPSVSVKVFEGTSDEFIIRNLDAMEKHQGGQPAFYNDKAFIRTLQDMGITDMEDLVNWDGCIEASIPGKWDFAAKGPWLNVEKVLDIAMHDGLDTKTGYRFATPPRPFAECADMEEVFEN